MHTVTPLSPGPRRGPRCRFIAALAMASALLTACGGSDRDADALVSTSLYVHASSLSASQRLLLRYRMPAVQGGHVEAQTLLFTPRGAAPASGWPLVVWAHGTTGVADGCAPSRNFDADQDKAVVEALLQAGFAVLAPDYEGLGTPGPHPYLSLSSAGRSVTQAVRAAHAVATVPLTRHWAVMGHSQGGFTALAAAQYAAEIAQDHPLRATVAMSPGADVALSAIELFNRMDDLQAQFERQPSGEVGDRLVTLVATTAYNGAMLAHGLQAQDAGLVPGRVLNSSFLSVAAQALSDPDCTVFMTALVQDLERFVRGGGKPAAYPAVRRDLLAQPGVADAFARNRPGQVRLEAPVYVLQGALDDQTPVGAARRLVVSMRAAGSQVTYVEVPDGTHGSVTETHLAAAIDFLRTQLAP